ncbi:phosphoribosylaminoimidazolesuccinocarboxamide synthase [Limosilactobacillus caecicola]|uniref:phosphoribosylaminoimidazolesuccinocarboxamide synthase n=1 Tax=Limosilactobacillus caecicola TaxID=2941332 RepID=UPI00203CA968|nr:phosphoribosylaminoimidazolesuccinocarboxamide synthase [Limosilactobacillus caecicola]
MMGKLLYSGKAKQMWSTDDPEQLRVVYLDQATMLNGKRKDHFAGKGAAANDISTLVFEYLIQQGIPTHFIKHLSEKEELVKKCDMIRLEFVTRNIVAGHFASRFGLKEGTPLAQPVEETFYKSDELDDPFANESDAIAIGACTADEYQKCWALARQCNVLLTKLFAKAGMKLVDFKLEFGKLSDGSLVLADEFSPDNCRLWDLDTNAHLDKDVFRKNLADITTTYDEVYQRLQKVVTEED